MTTLVRIGLGTVQFGMDYGISNRAGRPNEAEVAAILARAVASSVGYLDTAPAYGEAETLVGRLLPAGHGLRVVTKVPSMPDQQIESRHRQQWLDAIERSLRRLRIDRAYGVLVHHAADLDKPGWQHLIDALHEAKARGLVDRIGVSIYNEQQLALAESRFCPEIVQLPFNALDRRPMISGTFAHLKARGAEIHARSLFLQGLLLMTPCGLPEFFKPLLPILTNLRNEWALRGLSPIAACLAFAMRQPAIDAAIVGVNRRTEFDEIAAALAEAERITETSDGMLPEIDPIFLEPSRWPARTS
jgi:aryl-alcohol dehydrogenase-like predicted oxidoreductase